MKKEADNTLSASFHVSSTYAGLHDAGHADVGY